MTSSSERCRISCCHHGFAFGKSTSRTDLSGSISAKQEKILQTAKISIVSVGGPAEATQDMIQQNNLGAYFTRSAQLSTAVPLSFVFRTLDGRIEIDDAYLGGEMPGKRGRGAHHKTPFIAAVETTQDGRPMKVHLRRVGGFRQREIARYAGASLRPGSIVFSDGLACFSAVTSAGCRHVPIVTGSGRKAAQHPTFNWVNTLLGNIKTALTGTFHAIREKHVPRYLAEFEYRFNRRFDLPSMIERLAYVALRTPPMPQRLLSMAEQWG